MNQCKENTWLVLKRNYAICDMQLYIFFKKQLCVSFIPINSSYYFVHKNVKVQSKNKYLIYYEIFHISRQNIRIKYKISRKS